jgi:hypothetical protein
VFGRSALANEPICGAKPKAALYEGLAASQLAWLFDDEPTKSAGALNSSMKAPPNPGTVDA